MSRKKKKPKRPSPRQVIPFTSRAVRDTPVDLAPGVAVRVKPRVCDPDFPDLDLGGWTGTVLDVDADSESVLCQVEWTDETLERLDPAFRERCAGEGLDIDTIWLNANDLEPDASQPVRELSLRRAEGIGSRPKDRIEQESRIRAALSVPVGAEIPLVADSSLHTYYCYLASRLVFPLPCRILADREGSEPEKATLLGIMEFTDDPRFGLVAHVQRSDRPDFIPFWTVTVDEPTEANQLVEDYAFWFAMYSSLLHSDESAFQPLESRRPVWSTIRDMAAYGAGCGAATGALLVTDPSASYGMWVGMVSLGLIGLLAGARYGWVTGIINRVRFGSLYGGIFGTVVGVLFGTVMGVMLVGALGTIPGAILGSLLGSALAARRWDVVGRNSWAPLGACIGGLVLATWYDREKAFLGALVGAGAGAVLVPLVAMMLFVTLGLASRRPK